MMFDQHSLKACLAIWCVHQSLWHRDDDLHPNDHVAFYAKHVDMIVALRERESVNLQPPPLCMQDFVWTDHVKHEKGKYKMLMQVVIFWDRHGDSS